VSTGGSHQNKTEISQCFFEKEGRPFFCVWGIGVGGGTYEGAMKKRREKPGEKRDEECVEGKCSNWVFLIRERTA